MGRWRETLEERWNEWRLVEEAVSRTLDGLRVLRVVGPRTPRPLPLASKAIRSAELRRFSGSYEAGLACFCLGELKAEERLAFLEAWHERLGAGATVVIADRRGEGCESVFDLHQLFADTAAQLDIQVGRTFWWVRYGVKQQG
ncbi:hypothetical protein FHS18_005964 [Paenibacillus phyllosphaerae]|uniref:Uncharacterized protein n=1 Tax=Paenibacillus phyllosphaerae TaxID=274593 RepID=A0A7W5B4M4_9BACL|nr:hypothetical protein [Paenibacillus phyllosphaerae]MBB3113851.1 hypothetical protein [Paenibacillus phyllosphaerae]